MSSAFSIVPTGRVALSRVAAPGCVLLLLSMIGVASLARAPSFRVGGPPAWVIEVQPQLSATPLDSEDDDSTGYELLLADNQIDVTRGSVNRYRRRTSRVLSPAGIDDLSQIQIDFEPTYQKLTIHYIRILREGRTINALRPDEIQVIQQESELDQRIYNGTLSAIVFLNDVRVGDAIDYAYSIDGSNPVVGGRFASTFYLVEQEHCARLRYRLVWPAERWLNTRSHGNSFEPVVQSVGNRVEYTWDLTDVAAMDIDDSLPSWFNPYPRVQVGEFGGWNDVVNWAIPLYEGRASVDAELRGFIQKVRSQHADGGARLLAAARFVQDEVRYLGIELGPNSHRPTEPHVVFRRRFGDCKDKTLLLTTILRELGIEAYPALVNTEILHMLDEEQPSPYAFDHVIVKVELDGRTLWIDPTLTYQRGRLDGLYNPNYGRALVVRPSNDRLEEIPVSSSNGPTTSVSETYQMDAGGAVELEVVTTYRGPDADTMRFRLARQSITKLGRSYLNYYAATDPSIEGLEPLRVEDDQEQNILVTRERYRIPDFWRQKKRYIEADGIRVELIKPSISKRSMPLALTYPVHLAQRIEFRVPHSGSIPARDEWIRDANAELQHRVTRHGEYFAIDYEFKTLRDHVPPDEMAGYLNRLDGMLAATAHQLSATGSEAVLFLPLVALFLIWIPLIVILLVLGFRSGAARARRQGLHQAQPGLSLETAIRVSDENQTVDSLRAFRCRCGRLPYRADRKYEQVGTVEKERRLKIIRLHCEGCDAVTDLYFEVEPAAGGDGITGPESAE